jgi:diguanylate cyclase (GGDEF)-like protein
MRERYPTRVLFGCGAILVAMVVVGAGLAAIKLRERTLADNERELSNTALILAEHSDRALQAVELLHAGIQERMEFLGIASRQDFERRMSEQDVHELLKLKINGLPQIAVACLTSFEGRLINFSRSWPSMNLDVSDRDYIDALRSDPNSTSFVSEPLLNPATGQWTLYFARKFIAANGQFVGIVGVGVDLAYFRDFFGSVSLGQDSAIAILRRDGVMLARYPHLESVIGRSFIHRPPFQNLLRDTDRRSVQFKSQIDGHDRLVVARSLKNYPIVVVVATTMETAFAGWYQQTQLLIILTSLSICLISGIAFFLLRHWLQQQRRFRERLELEKLNVDTALNNMTHGLLLFDGSERIVACNRYYIEMYGLSNEVVKAGCTFSDLIRHRQETGSFAGDADQYRAELMRNLALGKPTETVIETPDGRTIRVVNKPLANGGWVATHDDVTERKRAAERIAYLAHYDALTGLPNRILFNQQLEHQLKWVRRGDQLALLYLDLDHFKSENDTLGHPAGDELLKAVAAHLISCLRETDMVARLGGDEFAIVQTGIKRPADITNLVNRIQETIRTPIKFGGHQLLIDASVGIAIAPDDGIESEELLKNADLAMYRAKADGRGIYRFFEPNMDARVKARHALELDLRQAIMCDEFELHYQPLVNLQYDKISGCEALMRWRHSKRGMISPEEFIPIAEETGLINTLGDWALRTACADAASWPNETKVAVNISPVQLRSGKLEQTVADILAASHLPASRLELEITEAVLIRDDETTIATLHQLRQLGVRIALDDFGTGYSSLGYLQRFPFDKIKIDQSFIKDVASKQSSLSIVQSVISIAKAQDITTTAEGVETQQQLELLRALGCTEMQGYLFSPAAPIEDIRRLLNTRKAKAVSAA